MYLITTLNLLLDSVAVLKITEEYIKATEALCNVCIRKMLFKCNWTNFLMQMHFSGILIILNCIGLLRATKDFQKDPGEYTKNISIFKRRRILD